MIEWPKSSRHNKRKVVEFLQGMVNRLAIGSIRYGYPTTAQNYMSRMEAEAKAYRKSGNREHLMNIANYAYLESVAPEHENSHYDDKVESVTRKKFGGGKV